jgi:hypothetical protein
MSGDDPVASPLTISSVVRYNPQHENLGPSPTRRSFGDGQQSPDSEFQTAATIERKLRIHTRQKIDRRIARYESVELPSFFEGSESHDSEISSDGDTSPSHTSGGASPPSVLRGGESSDMYSAVSVLRVTSSDRVQGGTRISEADRVLVKSWPGKADFASSTEMLRAQSADAVHSPGGTKIKVCQCQSNYFDRQCSSVLKRFLCTSDAVSSCQLQDLEATSDDEQRSFLIIQTHLKKAPRQLAIHLGLENWFRFSNNGGIMCCRTC